MAELKIWLSDSSNPQLYRTSFRHPLLDGDLRSIRGSTGKSCGAAGTFYWSPAVQALTILLLRSAAWARKGELEQAPPLLEGGAGSPAASLGYALDRQSPWLQEMFGLDRQGRLLARRTFSGCNIARKQCSPTIIGLNRKALSPASLTVCLDEKELADSSELERIADHIEQLWKVQRPAHTKPGVARPGQVLCDGRHGPLSDGGEASTQAGDSGVDSERMTRQELELLPQPFDQPYWWGKLRHAVLDEAAAGLRETLNFQPRALQCAVADLQNHPFFVKVAGKNQQLQAKVDQELASAERLGLPFDERTLRKHLCGPQTMRIAVSVGSAATIAMIRYLKEVKGYNIDVDFRFLHSQDIVRRLSQSSNGEFAGIHLAISCAARMLRSSLPYKPLMIMPRTSHRIVGPKRQAEPRSDSIDARSFLFLTDELSSSSFYFNEMKERGQLHLSKVHVENLESDELIVHLADEDDDSQAILWWPYYMFHEMFDTARPVDRLRRKWIYEVMTLFVHEPLIRDRTKAQCLDIAIRSAWLTLLENPALISAMLDPLLRNEEYMRFVYRANGLHNLDFPRILSRLDSDAQLRLVRAKSANQ